MTRLRYFLDIVAAGYTTRVFLPDGWQAVVDGTFGPAVPTRDAARRWLVRKAWRRAGENVRLDRVIDR